MQYVSCFDLALLLSGLMGAQELHGLVKLTLLY